MNYGEIWHLGRHTLMCGDATKREDIDKLIGENKVDLILTDPPYGMKCQRNTGSIGGNNDNGFMIKHTPAHVYPTLIGDNSQDTAHSFWINIQDYQCKKILWGGQYFAHFLPVSGAWIFWNKQNGNTDFSDGELAWISEGKRIRYYSQLWNGCTRGGKRVLELKSRIHPTQKPVELHMRILEDFSHSGDIIMDCFGGSGTTLIACMMELSPEYCDLIINRYQKLMPMELIERIA